MDSDVSAKDKDDEESTNLMNDSSYTSNLPLTKKSENEDIEQSTPFENFEKAVPFSKRKIWKNMLMISFGFFCLFTSFTSAGNLQSTMNKDDGMGPISLALLYVALIISFAIFGNTVVSKIGCKWSMFSAMISYLSYLASNMYPRWALMVPCSLLNGLGAGPLWTGFSLYFTQVSRWLARLTKTDEKDALTFCFGIFYMIWNLNKIVGNVISSVVLDTQLMNKTQPSQIEIERCIANENIVTSNITTLERPDDIKVYILCGVWIGFGLLGLTCILFVDNISLEVTQERKKVTTVVMSTIKHLLNSRKQQIITPVSIYSGMIQGFIIADFARSFVACALGIETIGYVMVCNGGISTVFSVILGRGGKYIGRLPIFTTAFLIAIGVQTTLLVWRPSVNSAPELYTISALLGIIECVLKAQLSALYGYVFRENVDSAYGNYYALEGIGFVIAFSYSSFVSTQHKLYILQGLLFISIVTYYTIEYMERKGQTEDNYGMGEKGVDLQEDVQRTEL